MNAQGNVPSSSPAGAVADGYRQNRSPLWRMVFDTIRGYRLSNMTDADDPSIAYPLVDLMSNPGPATIATGENEMALLTDEIVSALRVQAPKADGPQIGAELVPGSSALLHRIGDRTSFFATDSVTTAEYLVIHHALRLTSAQMSQADSDLPKQLRSARMMIDHGNGDVRDEPDPLHEAAAAEIDRLRAENVAKDELIARARSSAKLWAGHYERADEQEREVSARLTTASKHPVDTEAQT